MENVGMHGLRNLIILRKSDYWNLQRYNFFPFFTWEDGQHFRFHLDPDMIKEVGGLRASIKCRILSSKDSVHFNHSSVTSINELNRFNVIEKMETIVPFPIPSSLEDFIDKIGALSGVSPSGTAKSVLIKAADSSFDILSITKADYASGMYKIFNVSDPDRAAYTTTATLSYLREIGRPMKNLYNHLNPADVKEEFDKIVMWGSKLANHVETTDYELIEAELFQHPSHDLDPEMLYEILTNFRNFFWRQLRIQMRKQN